MNLFIDLYEDYGFIRSFVSLLFLVYPITLILLMIQSKALKRKVIIGRYIAAILIAAVIHMTYFIPYDPPFASKDITSLHFSFGWNENFIIEDEGSINKIKDILNSTLYIRTLESDRKMRDLNYAEIEKELRISADGDHTMGHLFIWKLYGGKEIVTIRDGEAEGFMVRDIDDVDLIYEMEKLILEDQINYRQYVHYDDGWRSLPLMVTDEELEKLVQPVEEFITNDCALVLVGCHVNTDNQGKPHLIVQIMEDESIDLEAYKVEIYEEVEAVFELEFELLQQ